jgi:hypothetical protein
VRQYLGLVALVVRDYEEALEFFCNTLDFTVVEDRPVPEQQKRFVIIAPPGARESRVLRRRHASATRPVAVFFCFCIRTISGATTNGIVLVAWSLCVNPKQSRTEPSRSSAICTAICGTWCSHPTTHPESPCASGRTERVGREPVARPVHAGANTFPQRDIAHAHGGLNRLRGQRDMESGAAV